MVKKCTGILGSYGNSGHRADLVSVRCADEYNMIVTTDVTGIVKVWDTRTQRCLQTVKNGSYSRVDPAEKEQNP